ncbi:MAG: tRNA glutamyl-Q(34) synthetase GluQRS, partial [Dokdonella sp.]
MPYRGRFAPSPTGQLHLGSLVAAVGSWLRARRHSGTWLVRIEDVDSEREVIGADLEMIETLARFGMESDKPVTWQSERQDIYREALDSLIASGHAYCCACSRRDLEPFGGIHPATCVVAAEPVADAAWRIRTDDQAVTFNDIRLGPQSFRLDHDGGDFVVQRREGWAAYQLAVAVDDAAQGITEVVRGADLLDSTPRQILLQRRLALSQPTYLHLPVVLGSDGRKLSKQDRATPVDPGDPMPAMLAALDVLGLPNISAADPSTALDAALHHPAWSASAVAGPTDAANAAMQREVEAPFGHTLNPNA